ncbi:hypothetical protein EH30_12950 [Erythrobacter sp. JL475]|nr:hypothetical protein EH30_12950 [Erythrobacter sp. JL475]
MDNQLIEMAEKYDCKVTRYADDIVFSGKGDFPDDIRVELRRRFANDGIWKLSKSKELLQPLKGRIKIHGLLIGEDSIRLTKGYRNKLRAFAHVIEAQGNRASNLASLRGHLHYAAHLENVERQSSGLEPIRMKELLTRSRPKGRSRESFFGKLRNSVRSILKADQKPLP